MFSTPGPAQAQVEKGVRLRRVILLLIDGLRPDVAEAELARGTLPNLARLTAAGGVGRAITVFPSTTSVAYLPFLTGCLPGRCNVPSIRWLDRDRYRGQWWRGRDAVRSYCGYQAGRLDDDLAPDVRTIFELITESAAFFTMITRGLTSDRDPIQGQRKLWGALSHYLQWHQPGDDAVAKALLAWIETARPWRFLFAQFPAVDGYTHQSTPDGPKVLAALRGVDQTVGALRAALERHRITDDTLILVVSDHGATVVDHHLDLAEWFRRRGVATLAHPELWRPDPLAGVMVAGNGSAMIYARPNESRPGRWPLARLRNPASFGTDRDLLAELVREPGIAFLAAEERPGTVAVVDAHGHATVEERGGTIAYRMAGSDPLAIGADWEGSRRGWLQRTFDGAYPDGPVQLLDQFAAPRTGDAIVVARKGFDLRDRWEIPEHRSGHGSMIREHMQTPLWTSQPRPQVALRTADLFPSMLHWLGEPIPGGIDGELAWAP